MKTYRINIILIVTALFSFSISCVKEKVTPRDYPIVETEQCTEITTSGAMLKGNIIYNDGSEIIDHGFIWGPKSNISFYESDNLSLGSFDNMGEFSGMATKGMAEDLVVYYRAYIKTDGYTVLGNTMSFTSKGCDPPIVTGYTPHTASIFDIIYITGDNLSIRNIIYFGDAPASTITVSETEIQAVVPNTITEVNPTIKLASGGHLVDLTPDFTLLIPEIYSYSPASARIGQEVTITGSNFPVNNGHSLTHVFIGSQGVAITSLSSTELIVKVPSRVVSASEPIRVVSTFLDETFDENLTLEAPLISSMSKITGTIGEQVTLYGEGFHYYLVNNVVLLGGEPVSVTSTTETQLSLRILPGFSLPTGDYKFSITMFGLTSESAEYFHYVAPVK